MRNERCGEKNTQLKALVILHPDTVVRGDAVMSDSYHYHCNSSEEILTGLQKQQTRCLKDSSPLNIKSLWLAIMISLYLRSLCKLGWNKFVSDQLLVDTSECERMPRYSRGLIQVGFLNRGADTRESCLILVLTILGGKGLGLFFFFYASLNALSA